MPEIARFVNGGAGSITPAIAEKVVRQLPQWKLEFTQISAPKFPHLVDQLEFLADVVEDGGKKRKAKSKASQGVEKLKKVNVSGTAKLSTFFQKK